MNSLSAALRSPVGRLKVYLPGTAHQVRMMFQSPHPPICGRSY